MIRCIRLWSGLDDFEDGGLRSALASVLLLRRHVRCSAHAGLMSDMVRGRRRANLGGSVSKVSGEFARTTKLRLSGGIAPGDNHSAVRRLGWFR